MTKHHIEHICTTATAGGLPVHRDNTGVDPGLVGAVLDKSMHLLREAEEDDTVPQVRRVRHSTEDTNRAVRHVGGGVAEETHQNGKHLPLRYLLLHAHDGGEVVQTAQARLLQLCR